ncbi:MAG: alkaline phosphatase family protein [bacterium]
MLRAQPVAITLRLTILFLLFAGCGSDRERTEPWAPGRVFVLGLDGLDPGLVSRFEKEGLLPHFAQLRKEGAVGRVRSTIPMISPPAWTSASTGTLPADHGIWSFWLPTGGARGAWADATDRLAPAIWEDLSANGRSVGIVNVPMSCPPDTVNGFMISGFPYPEGAPLTWPPSLEQEIVRDGWLRDAFGGPPEPGREEQWLAEVRKIAEARRRIGLGLLFERKPDFSFIVFTTPDRIQHHLWKFHDPRHPHHRADASDVLKNAVRDAYVWCDAVLGEVMAKLPEGTTLLVVSDHGFGPAYLGISKARVLADLAANGSGVATSRNLFGGDFYLEDRAAESRARVATALSALVGDSGQPLVQAVHDTRAEEHRGWGADLGPDLVAEEAEGFLFVPGEATDPLVGPLPPTAFSGYHRRAGFFAARGRPIVPGEVRDCSLPDVPALALHLLGEKIPRRYTQNVPRRLFPAEHFLKRPMEYVGRPQEGLRKPDRATFRIDPAVEEQLRGLGYVN